jgi:hypothetical protein
VRQIIVTLRYEDHEELRRWAAGKGLGQDKAAAWIISAFLRSTGADHNGANGRADDRRIQRGTGG